MVQPSPRIPEQRNPVSISSYSSCLLVVSSRKPLTFLSSVCFPTLDILYEWSPPVCRFMTGTFHSAFMFSGFYLVSRYQSFILFSWLSNRPLYKYNTFIHQLMGLWVVSALWLLWIILLWTFMCMCLCGHICSSVCYIPRSGIARLWGKFMFKSLWRIAKLFHSGCTIFHSC